MTDAQIAALMGWPLEYMADVTDPLSMVARVRALVAAAEAGERERCATLLDAEHERIKHRNNYAAVHALMIRESGAEKMAIRRANLTAAIRGN